MSEQGGGKRLAGRIEVRSIDWVPEGDRHGRVSDQSKFWFLGNFQFLTIAMGFIGPGMGLSLGWTALAGALGVFIGTFFMAFHANQGAELGLPQMIQSRAQFGYRGVILPLVATLVTYVGFNVLDTILIADGGATLLGWDPLALSAGVAVLAAVLAIWGHDWLHLVFKILFWISLPLFSLLSLAIVAGAAGGAPAADLGFNWVGFCTELAAGASYNITYATYVSDYSRYLPPNISRRRVILSVFFGASLSAVWLIALGAWLATRFGATDALVALDQAGNAVFPGFGGILALCSVTVLTAVMGMNAYSGMLTVVTAVDSVRKVRPTRTLRIVTIAFVALLWLVVAHSLGGEEVEAVNSVFVIMLYMLAPWTAINLLDYYLVRRGDYAVTHLFRPDGIYGTWRRQGITAYLVGFCASLPFIVLPGMLVGPVAEMLGGIDVGWLVGLGLTGAVYLFLVRNHDRAAEFPAIRQSRLDLQALEQSGVSR